MKRLLFLVLFVSLPIFGAANLGTLTLTGTSTAEFISNQYSNHTFIYTVTGISDNVVVRPEGTIDGTTWVSLSDAQIDTEIKSTSLSASNGFMDHKSDFYCEKVRVSYISKSPSTVTPSINIKYQGR